MTPEPWAGWVFSECNLSGHPSGAHWHPPVGATPPTDPEAEVSWSDGFHCIRHKRFCQTARGHRAQPDDDPRVVARRAALRAATEPEGDAR